MLILIAILIALIVVVAAALPLVLLVYIYKDAQSRNMNGLLWVLISIILPVPIGLIVYLVAREQSPVARCSNCGEYVKDSYVVCPRCCAPLHSACPQCGCAIQPGWSMCPNCGTNVKNVAPSATGVETESKSHLGRNVIIVAVVLLFMLIFSAITLFSVMVTRTSDIVNVVEEICSAEFFDDYDDYDDYDDDDRYFDDDDDVFVTLPATENAETAAPEASTAHDTTTTPRQESVHETESSVSESERISMPKEPFSFEVN